MNGIFHFADARPRDPAVEAWFAAHTDALGALARHWFAVMCGCGEDVSELLHDGQPTACAGDAAFGYVNAFRSHANVGFFRGAELADPAKLLEGTGKYMRHVKLRPDRAIDTLALAALVTAAYADMKRRTAAKPG